MLSDLIPFYARNLPADSKHGATTNLIKAEGVCINFEIAHFD